MQSFLWSGSCLPLSLCLLLNSCFIGPNTTHFYFSVCATDSRTLLSYWFCLWCPLVCNIFFTNIVMGHAKPIWTFFLFNTFRFPLSRNLFLNSFHFPSSSSRSFLLVLSSACKNYYHYICHITVSFSVLYLSWWLNHELCKSEDPKWFILAQQDLSVWGNE